MKAIKVDKSIEIFQRNGGTLRAAQALECGIHPRDLYEMRDTGKIVQLSRGVYRLAEIEESVNSDLAVVATRVSDGVICLISALSFHEITSEIPQEVFLAIPRRKDTPRISFPPTRSFRFSDDTIVAGVEKRPICNAEVKIFSMEKTIADCFKFRNRIGIRVALEGMKMCLAKNGSRVKILEYARICRVERIISPYLEAID